MIDYETYIKIKTCHEQNGLCRRQIANYLGLDHRTVDKWLSEKRFRQRKSVVRAGKLDPFKDRINGLLERYPYTATQIFQRICEQGFAGGYSIVKEYVRKVRPRKSRAFLKLSFAPAECAQVDWGSYGSVNVGSTKRRLSFFVMVLCYSRIMPCPSWPSAKRLATRRFSFVFYLCPTRPKSTTASWSSAA